MDNSIRLSRPASGTRSSNVFTSLFKAFGRFIVDLGEGSPVMKALDRLQATSDEMLLAKGLTRDAELRRILGPCYPL